jgi:hypothetical protein
MAALIAAISWPGSSRGETHRLGLENRVPVASVVLASPLDSTRQRNDFPDLGAQFASKETAMSAVIEQVRSSKIFSSCPTRRSRADRSRTRNARTQGRHPRTSLPATTSSATPHG